MERNAQAKHSVIIDDCDLERVTFWWRDDFGFSMILLLLRIFSNLEPNISSIMLFFGPSSSGVKCVTSHGCRAFRSFETADDRGSEKCERMTDSLADILQISLLPWQFSADGLVRLLEKVQPALPVTYAPLIQHFIVRSSINESKSRALHFCV